MKKFTAIILIICFLFCVIIDCTVGVQQARAAFVVDDALYFAAAVCLVIGGICFLTSDAADTMARDFWEWLPESAREVIKNFVKIGQIYWDPVLFRYLWQYRNQVQEAMDSQGYYVDKNNEGKFVLIDSGAFTVPKSNYAGVYGGTFCSVNKDDALSNIYKMKAIIPVGCKFNVMDYDYSPIFYSTLCTVYTSPHTTLFTDLVDEYYNGGSVLTKSIMIEVIVDATNYADDMTVRTIFRFGENNNWIVRLNKCYSNFKYVSMRSKAYPAYDDDRPTIVWSKYVYGGVSMPVDMTDEDIFNISEEGEFVDAGDVEFGDSAADENLVVNLGDIATNIEDLVGKTAAGIEGVEVKASGIYGVLQQLLQWVKSIGLAITGLWTLLTTGLIGDPGDLIMPDISVETFSTKFPFSLPWDLKNAISSLAYTEDMPEFELKWPDGLGGNVMMMIRVPQAFGYVVTFIRAAFLLIFMIGLVYLTPKLLGGAK